MNSFCGIKIKFERVLYTKITEVNLAIFVYSLQI